MDLELEDEIVGSWSIVSVAGELDMHTTPTLQERLDALSAVDAPKIALDPSAVPFMDSSSLRMLIVNLKRLRERRGDLALVGVSGSPQKVLAITGIDRLIPLYETRPPSSRKGDCRV